MSMDLGRHRLFKEFEQLRLRWRLTEGSWRDAVRDTCETDYFAPLEASVLVTVSAADRLTPLLQQLRQECGLPSESL